VNKNNEPLTRVWQKWRFSAPQTHLWLIKVWFSAQGGRELDRSEFADAVEENNKRYHENTSLYRKRQELERSGTHEDK
jgi:hypothetical protein